MQTVRHFFPRFSEWLDELPDSRFEPFIIYAKRFLCWWGLLLFVLKLGSRRQLDFDLRDLDTEVLDNVNRLARAEQETLPVHGTLNHFLGHVRAGPFACGRAIQIAEDNGWSYVHTFKPGGMRAVWADFQVSYHHPGRTIPD